jgi:hypothetical protein
MVIVLPLAVTVIASAVVPRLRLTVEVEAVAASMSVEKVKTMSFEADTFVAVVAPFRSLVPESTELRVRSTSSFLQEVNTMLAMSNKVKIREKFIIIVVEKQLKV